MNGLLPPGTAEVVAVLVRFPASPIEWIFVIAGFLGMILHWWNANRLGHTLDTLIEHFITIDTRYSVATVAVYWLAAMWILSTVDIGKAAWTGAVVAGVALGYFFDSFITKKS